VEEEIRVKYRKGGFATAGDVVLATTATTRTVFRPGLHDGGVRGQIVRQKGNAQSGWKDLNEVDFRKLPEDCGVCIDLDTEATERLFGALDHHYEVQSGGIKRHDQDYVIAPKDRVLLVDSASQAQAIRELIAQGKTEEFWRILIESDEALANRLAAGKLQQDREDAIRQFKASLSHYPANESYWQQFFQDHPWMMQSAFSAAVFMLGGETYVGGKRPVGRQGRGGVATDFLFSDASTKSFAVVEIKTPSSKLVGSIYRGKEGSGDDNETYSMHADLSGAIVQTRNQIAVAVDQFEAVLARGEFNLHINRIHPKGVLIIGSLDDLTERQASSFNHFRNGQYSLTVITYDELLRRLGILYDVELG
jgi:hypothetical protein